MVSLTNGNYLLILTNRLDYKVILRRRDDLLVAKVFSKYQDPGRGLLLRSMLTPAFEQLGVLRQEHEFDELFSSFDIDKNGGLDLDEFKSAVRQPSDIEQWIDRLPLGSVLAQSMIMKVGGDSLQK